MFSMYPINTIYLMINCTQTYLRTSNEIGITVRIDVKFIAPLYFAVISAPSMPIVEKND